MHIGSVCSCANVCAYRLFECSSQLSPFLQYVGYHIICSTYMLITSPTLHRQTIRRTYFLASIGWQWPTVWWIRSFTIGWIDDFGIIFNAYCAFAVFASGKWIMHSLSKIQCQLNGNRDYVSIFFLIICHSMKLLQNFFPITFSVLNNAWVADWQRWQSHIHMYCN